MNTYGVFTSDGKRITIVKGDKIENSGADFINVYADGKKVAIFPAQGGFAVVLEQTG